LIDSEFGKWFNTGGINIIRSTFPDYHAFSDDRGAVSAISVKFPTTERRDVFKEWDKDHK
jgi:hypothetical protein